VRLLEWTAVAKYFVPGTIFTLTIFADGTTRSLTATIPVSPPLADACPRPPRVCN
jgi:hypothetical protein